MKTNLFTFSWKKVDLLNYNFENTSIDRVCDFKFLGLTINEHLNWKSHIDNYCTGLQMRTDSQITKNVFLRVLRQSKYNDHTEPIFKTLKLLKVNDILKLQKWTFYYKYENNLLPYYLQRLPFQFNSNSHATRSENIIVQWRPMHYYAKRCIRYNIPSTL